MAPALTMASLLPEPADTCPDLRKEYEGKKIVLKNLEDGILGDLCGDEDDLKCTKLIVTSDGPSAVMQGTRPVWLIFLIYCECHAIPKTGLVIFFSIVKQLKLSKSILIKITFLLPIVKNFKLNFIKLTA